MKSRDIARVIAAALPVVIEQEPFLLTDGRGELAQGRTTPLATFVVEGEVRGGGSERVSAGELLWGAAGEPVGQSRVLRVWLAPGEAQPSAMRLDEIPERKSPGVRVRVLSGRVGDVSAPKRATVPLMMLDVHMATRSSTLVEVPAGHVGFAHVLAGPVTVGSRVLLEGEVGWLDDEMEAASLSIAAGPTGARVFFCSATALEVD